MSEPTNDTNHAFRPPPDGTPVGQDWTGLDECSHRFESRDEQGRRVIRFCGKPRAEHPR